MDQRKTVLRRTNGGRDKLRQTNRNNHYRDRSRGCRVRFDDDEPVRPARDEAGPPLAILAEQMIGSPCADFHHGPGAQMAPLQRPEIRLQSDLRSPAIQSLRPDQGKKTSMKKFVAIVVLCR